MDIVLFVVTLLNLSCCCIVTTSIVFKLLYFPLLKESLYEEELRRHVKATVVFLLVELFTSIAMVAITLDALLPLILLVIGWIVSGAAMFYNCELFDVNTLATELLIRRLTYVRLILWFARFICVFAFVVSVASH